MEQGEKSNATKIMLPLCFSSSLHFFRFSKADYSFLPQMLSLFAELITAPYLSANLWSPKIEKANYRATPFLPKPICPARTRTPCFNPVCLLFGPFVQNFVAMCDVIPWNRRRLRSQILMSLECLRTCLFHNQNRVYQNL